MPVECLCVLLSVEEVEEKWVVVMGPAVHAAHPLRCWGQKETLTLERPMDRRAARHSTSRLQPNGHLGSAGAVSYDAVESGIEGDDLWKVNDGAVTTIAHLADGSWNVDVVGHYAGHIGGRGHSGHVGRGCDHNPASQSRGHDYIHVCRGHCRSRVNDHQSLSDGHSPFCQARNSASHIVCRHDDSRLLLAHPSRTEGDRVSFCGEDGVHWDDKSYCTVGATVAVEIFEENVGAFLEVDDLEEPQSRA